jgi:hypothetical protein
MCRKKTVPIPRRLSIANRGVQRQCQQKPSSCGLTRSRECDVYRTKSSIGEVWAWWLASRKKIVEAESAGTSIARPKSSIWPSPQVPRFPQSGSVPSWRPRLNSFSSRLSPCGRSGIVRPHRRQKRSRAHIPALCTLARRQEAVLRVLARSHAVTLMSLFRSIGSSADNAPADQRIQATTRAAVTHYHARTLCWNV